MSRSCSGDQSSSHVRSSFAASCSRRLSRDENSFSRRARSASFWSQCRRQRRRKPLAQLHQPPPFRAGLAGGRGRAVALRLQLLADRGLFRLGRGAGGLERLALLARLLLEFQQAAAALFQPARQLLFLLFQRPRRWMQARFLLIQRRLLGDHGGGLDAQRVALGLHGLLARRGDRFQAEPERPDGDFVAVAEGEERCGLVVDEDAAVAGEVAQEEAVRPVDERGVQRLNALDVEAHLAAGRLAEQGQRPGQRPAGAAEPAVDDDQLRGRGGAAGRRRGLTGLPCGSSSGGGSAGESSGLIGRRGGGG